MATDHEPEGLEFIDELDVEGLDDTEADDQIKRLERMRRLLDATIDSLESSRSSHRTVDSAFIAYERNKRVPLTLLAGALASRLVIFVIPFVVILVIATGWYSDVSQTDPLENAREAGMGGMMAAAVANSTDLEYGARTVTVVAVLFATLWAADSIGKLVRRIAAIIWGTPLRRVHRRWMLSLGVILVSVVSLLLSRLGLEAGSWDGPIVLGEFAVEFLALTALWLGLSFVLPHPPEADSWKDHLPGALLIAGGVIAMKWVTIFYFAPRALSLNERYGEIASAILLLTWAYWIAFILVLAAELNASLFKSRRAT